MEKKRKFNIPVPTCKHYKETCVFCEEKGKEMNKEHIFPQWLLKKTDTYHDEFNWVYGRISANNLVIPLCKECNYLLGKELESKVERIFTNIENGLGFNDHEAELLIKWMWKITGMFYWTICYDGWKYSVKKMKEHVLGNIEFRRSRISIGIGLIKEGCSDFIPVGLDSMPLYSNLYASGVFSRLSIIVFYTDLIDYVNRDYWTIYTLSDAPTVMNLDKKVYPKIAFENGYIAVGITKIYAGQNSSLEKEHEKIALKIKINFEILDEYCQTHNGALPERDINYNELCEILKNRISRLEKEME